MEWRLGYVKSKRLCPTRHSRRSRGGAPGAAAQNFLVTGATPRTHGRALGTPQPLPFGPGRPGTTCAGGAARGSPARPGAGVRHGEWTINFWHFSGTASGPDVFAPQKCMVHIGHAEMHRWTKRWQACSRTNGRRRVRRSATRARSHSLWYPSTPRELGLSKCRRSRRSGLLDTVVYEVLG